MGNWSVVAFAACKSFLVKCDSLRSNKNTLTSDTHDEQGKVEAEFELLTQEEAEKKPAGRAREDPQALEKPK